MKKYTLNDYALLLENARLMKDAGANIFVVGTASVFSKDNTLDDGIKKMRNVIKENK